MKIQNQNQLEKIVLEKLKINLDLSNIEDQIRFCNLMTLNKGDKMKSLVDTETYTILREAFDEIWEGEERVEDTKIKPLISKIRKSLTLENLYIIRSAANRGIKIIKKSGDLTEEDRSKIYDSLILIINQF
jgi:hypothetical protein